MARIQIRDVPKDTVIDKSLMKRVHGGQMDKPVRDCTLGSAIPENPWGYDTDDPDSGTDNTSDGYDNIPDVNKAPSPGGPIPVPYPNIVK